MTNYKLFSTSVATADGVATLDIAEDGKLCGCCWYTRVTAGAGGIASGRLEISFASTSGFATNDTRSSIFGWCYATSPGAATAEYLANGYVALPDIPINAGERLFMHHIIGTAASAAQHTCWLYVMDKADRTRRLRI